MGYWQVGFMVFVCSVVVLLLAAFLGGGTRQGFLGDIVVQLAAIPLFAVAFWQVWQQEGPSGQRNRRLIIVVACGGVFLTALQLSGLVAGSGFPTDSPVVDMQRSQLSMTPEASWAAAASLIVPFAIFAAAIQLNFPQRMRICWLLLGVGALALVFGFLQVAQGPDSGLRFYRITNLSEAVGLFANRNHFAAQLYVTLVLAGLWFAMVANRFWTSDLLRSRAILWFACAAVFLVALVAGLAMARSRAGLLLAIVALAGIILMVVRQGAGQAQSKKGQQRGLSRLTFFLVVFAALFAAQVGLGKILSRFQGDEVSDLRVPLNRTTFRTAVEALPFGTGLGSFVSVYGAVEKKDDVFVGFANRAHDEYAEFFLEAGLPGAILVLGFMIWYGRSAYRVWREAGNPGSEQRLLERGATLVILLLLIHSSVDYPLRTTALASVFAFFCAILAAPVAEEIQVAGTPAKRRRKERPVPQPWLGPLSWPEGWRRVERSGRAAPVGRPLDSDRRWHGLAEFEVLPG